MLAAGFKIIAPRFDEVIEIMEISLLIRPSCLFGFVLRFAWTSGKSCFGLNAC